MPSLDELLATPFEQWSGLPKTLTRLELYDERHSGTGIVAWESLYYEGEHRYILFSPEYDRLVGISQFSAHYQWSGKTPVECFSPADAAKVTTQYDLCVEAGEQITYSEYLCLCGQWRWWRTTLRPVKDASGKVWKLLGWSEQIVSIEAELRDAIANQDLEVHFQPICEMSSGCIVGFEALVRWPNSAYTPVDFLPLAKQNGLINDITAFVIDQAGAALSQLPNGVWVSVNVSNCNFDVPLESATSKHEFDPSLLRFEITEDTQLTARALARFASVQLLGHLLEIDDFGTESSNLLWLQQIKAIGIKLDLQFVRGAYQDSNKAEICRSAISLAKNYNPPLEVIVEGIETVDDLLFMQSLGADYGQGYYFSKPLPVDKAVRLLE